MGRSRTLVLDFLISFILVFHWYRIPLLFYSGRRGERTLELKLICQFLVQIIGVTMVLVNIEQQLLENEVQGLWVILFPLSAIWWSSRGNAFPFCRSREVESWP